MTFRAVFITCSSQANYIVILTLLWAETFVKYCFQNERRRGCRQGDRKSKAEIPFAVCDFLKPCRRNTSDLFTADVIELAGDLLHLTCRDFSGFQQKQLAYAAAWAQERHQRGKKTSLAAIFGHTLGAFVKTLLLRGGILDGKQGWLLAVVNAQYTFNKYTELWALSRGYSEKVSL